MAFVNEYVSDEDVEKYGIAQLRDELHAYHQRRYHWTRDRERDVYLVQIHHLGRDLEPEDWLLYEKGRYCAVRLHLEGGSKNYSERPYRILWYFDGFSDGWLRCPVPSEEEQPHIIQLLKEALTAYGEGGVNSYVSDTIVSFTF